MTQRQRNELATGLNSAGAQPVSDARPTALGFVRGGVSGQAAARHEVAVRRHARAMGYRYVYTVRPPDDCTDPVGFVLGLAAAAGIVAIVVHDLAHVDDRPARICENFDLETVCPPSTWARVGAPPRPGPVPSCDIHRAP
ncbi:hypothetical protein [Nocardia amikacinitolerans]|uniref:hypothetical protein n=1 Tax=Nocardia amikacinitolerans TaxID=756689 RepID=UPI0020A27382|nr:hypothetical protein [Nocardia amikacinitolerans]